MNRKKSAKTTVAKTTVTSLKDCSRSLEELAELLASAAKRGAIVADECTLNLELVSEGAWQLKGTLEFAGRAAGGIEEVLRFV